MLDHTADNPFESPTQNGAKFIKQPPGRRWKRRLFLFSLVAVLLFLVVAMLMPMRRGPGREGLQRTSCLNNLRMIAIAIHNYETEHGELPPAYTVDDSGKPLHSWRTLILPYLEQNELYESIDLTKPWDDPVNQHARTKVLNVYACPSVSLKPGFTTYLANSWDEGVFVPGGPAKKFKDITDGTANTIMIFETRQSNAVEWMSPQDGNHETFFSRTDGDYAPHTTRINVAMVDCSAHSIFESVESDAIRAFFTIAGGEKAILHDFK